MPVEISTYSRRYHGQGTATGQRYDHVRGYTAATTTRRGQRFVLPPGSEWEVEYLGKRLTVRINDNGPTEPRMGPKYWLDLSGKAWADLTGIAPSRKVAKMRRVK